MERRTIGRLCAGSGVVAIALFFFALIIPGFLPPPSPSLTVSEVGAIYHARSSAICLGMLLLLIAGMFVAPVIGFISEVMNKMHDVSKALVYTQLGSGTAVVILFYIPALLFIATAYRTDRPADITYALNDLCWIAIILPWPAAFMQNVALGISILRDRSTAPILPRWLGFLNFWIAVGFIPSSMLVFVKKGPFAWNGVISFWLPASVFGIWFICMTWALWKAADRLGPGRES